MWIRVNYLDSTIGSCGCCDGSPRSSIFTSSTTTRASSSTHGIIGEIIAYNSIGIVTTGSTSGSGYRWSNRVTHKGGSGGNPAGVVTISRNVSVVGQSAFDENSKTSSVN